MSERANGHGKLIAGAAAFLAVVGGSAYWYFGIHAKNQARDAAQAEILRWETRLGAARECLFGKTPASGDSGEALAVRELLPDPWERTTCTPLVGKIARGAAEDTGIMPVEHAWMTLDRAASKVATAFAVSKDPYGKTAADERRGVSSLPDALRELDSAHAALRAAAKMPPPETGAKTASLPLAQVLPLQLAGSDVDALYTSTVIPSRGALVARGHVRSANENDFVQVTLQPGAAPVIARTGDERVLLAADGAWAARDDDGKIVASPVDAAGAFGAPASVADGTRVRGVAGTYADGAIVFRTLQGIGIARSAAGVFTADPPIVTQSDVVAHDRNGRALVAWTEYPSAERARSDGDADLDTSPMLRATILSSGAVPKVIELGTGDPVQACLTSTHGWVFGREGLMRFDDTSAMSADARMYALLGCSDTAALLHHSDTKYTVCKPECHTVQLRNARPSDVATLVGDRVVSLLARDRVLAVWSEDREPKFYRLPEKVVLRRAISDGKTIDVVADATTEGKPERIVIVRIPV